MVLDAWYTTSMKMLYGLLGVALLIILAGVVYVFNQKEHMSEVTTLTLTSSVFDHNGTIPETYTCDGANINPPLSISGVPNGTKSLALIVDDPDIPQVFKDQRGIDSFDHWSVYNLSPDTTEIQEGSVVGSMGLNSRSEGEAAYTGPCPPTEYEPTEHRYFFKLYALSGTLNFIKAPTKTEIEQAIDGMIIEQVELIGLYDRAHK